MPLMDGYHAVKKIHKLINEEKLRDIPVIACTADASNENLEKCKKCGFDEILFKPIHLARLEKILEELSF